MRKLIIILLFLLPFFNFVQADTRKTIWHGLDAEIVSITDSMTDKESGVIFWNIPNSPIYLAIYGHDNFAIWSTKDDLFFSSDSTHLIRVGENPPLPLLPMDKRNGLKPSNPIDAEKVIRGLAEGKTIKIRYFDWPKYNPIDRMIQNPNFAFIYGKAATIFGWENLGTSAILPPVKLHIYSTEDGYASISVINNDDLGFIKDNGGKHKGVNLPGGYYITIKYQRIFGFYKGKWICSTDILSRNVWGSSPEIIIRDQENKIIFREQLPTVKLSDGLNTSWPLAQKAAKAAWDVAPFGTIEVTNSSMARDRILLYGFRELWKWGIENAGFPSLE